MATVWAAAVLALAGTATVAGGTVARATAVRHRVAGAADATALAAAVALFSGQPEPTPPDTPLDVPAPPGDSCPAAARAVAARVAAANGTRLAECRLRLAPDPAGPSVRVAVQATFTGPAGLALPVVGRAAAGPVIVGQPGVISRRT